MKAVTSAHQLGVLDDMALNQCKDYTVLNWVHGPPVKKVAFRRYTSARRARRTEHASLLPESGSYDPRRVVAL
jgi:hypothetical protein